MRTFLRRGAASERPEEALHLVVGLGNPGPKYAHTRHNVGADTVALLAERHNVALRAERGTSALAAKARLSDSSLVLAIPQTYVNESGLALRGLTKHYRLDRLDHVIVVHDELDLPVGVVRIKLGGGTAGHNGLRSIESHLQTLDFARVRIGIGKPPSQSSGADYVLRRPGAKEAEAIAVALERAADAVELIATQGPEAAMNLVNTR